MQDDGENAIEESKVMKTEFRALFNLFDVTAIPDGTLSAADNQPFGNIALAKDDVAFPDYATLEEDYFILDGSKAEMPDNPTDVVYFSREMSDKNGTFSAPPQFIINFSNNHTSYGLTFYFVGDHPLEMEVLWFGLDGVVIAKKKFSVTKNEFFAQNQVENYGKVLARFTKAKPYRYVKLRYIEYGTRLLFGTGGIAIKDASLTEDTDYISDKIAINKMTFKLVDEDGGMNIGNADGIHKTFQAGQECIAYERAGDTEMLLGRFFLASFKSAKSIVTMSLEDYKGILDNNRFLDGRVYAGAAAGGVIDEIMAAAGIAEYEVADDVRSVPLYGWLKNQTCRQALREVLFACGAVIDTSRRMIPSIYIPEKKIRYTVGRNRKFSTSASVDKYISDVSVKCSQYTLQTSTSEIAKGSYTAGTHTVELSAPAAEMTISAGTIAKQSNNYVTFRLDSAQSVVISGKKYTKEDLTATASIKDIEAGNGRNVKSFSCTVLSAGQAQAVAQRVLEYYQNRLLLKAKFLSAGEPAARWADVENPVGTYAGYTAVFEKMTTNLTDGFITTAQMRGYYKVLNHDYYAGELYAGEDFGVM